MKKPTLVKAMATLVVTGALLCGATGTANATVSNVNGTFLSNAACNYVSHTLSAGGSVRLSSRWPNGQWIETRYSYVPVSLTTLLPTGAGYTTAWTVSWAKPGTYTPPATALSGGIPVDQWTSLPTLNLNNVFGYWRVAVQIATWNGSGWELNDADLMRSYATSNQYGYQMQNSVCVGSR